MGYVARSLFEEYMLGGLDSILECSIPGIELNFIEFFEGKDERRRYGYIPFLRWKAKADKPSLYKAAKEAWEKLQVELIRAEGGEDKPKTEWVNFPRQRRNPQGGRAASEG